jgi:hypothetical protein
MYRARSGVCPTLSGVIHELTNRYYEWLKRPSSKVAHFTRLPLGPKDTNVQPPLIFFAGLYDIVKYISPVESRFQPSTDESDTREPYPTGNPLPLATFTILTTTPSKDIEWLHDRMPCILDKWEDVERWLDLGEMKGWEEGKGGTGDLLRGFPGLDWYVYPMMRGWSYGVVLTRSFPVPPEVGKIGKDSPTFIQPVSERSDGIKSFFNKQTTSPAKPKVNVKAEMDTQKGSDLASSRNSSSTKREENDVDIKVKAEGIKSEITTKDEELGLGDDSNAPNLKTEIKEEAEAKGEREVEKEEDEEDKDTSTTLTKRKRDEKGGAGHRTKVTRRDEDDSKKDVSVLPYKRHLRDPRLRKGGELRDLLLANTYRDELISATVYNELL